MTKQKKPLVLKPESSLKALTREELEMAHGGNIPKQPDCSPIPLSRNT